MMSSPSVSWTSLLFVCAHNAHAITLRYGIVHIMLLTLSVAVIGQKPYSERTNEDSNHPGFDSMTRFVRMKYYDLSRIAIEQSGSYRQLQQLQWDQRFVVLMTIYQI